MDNTHTLNDLTHPILTTSNDNYHIDDGTLSVYHTNIHSLIHKLELLIKHLELFTKQPDIIVLTDTYLIDQTSANSFQIAGYAVIHKKDISIYYRTNMNVTTLELEISPSASTIIQIHDNQQKTNPIHTFIGIYRRPHTDKAEFLKNIQEAIDDILTKNPTTSITIIGDMNMDLLHLTPTQTFLVENGLYTTITTHTRIDPVFNTKSLIDHILTTRTSTKITAGTISPPLSDHLPIYTVFHKDPPRKKFENKKTLSLKRYEKHQEAIDFEIETKIKETLATHYPLTTSQELQLIQQAITTVIEKYERTPRPRRKQWCNLKLKRRIKKQHRLHKIRTSNPTPANIRRHANYRNRLRKDIILEKKKHVTRLLQVTKNNPKEQAKILKSLIPGKGQQRNSPTCLT